MRRPARSTATMAVLLALSAATAAYGVTTSRTADDGVIDSALDEHGHSHAQHGGGEGHLSPTSANVRLVGAKNVTQDFEGRVSDVGVLGDHAYLGAFYERDCRNGGTYVFDISDPAAPKEINFIRAQNGSYVGEGVHVVRLETPVFSGDVLAQNLEICGDPRTGAQGGFNLVDVTNPRVEQHLAHGGDFSGGSTVAHTYHSVFMWQEGEKAYLVGVDNEEAADVDIFDITDPRSPQLVVEYDLNRQTPQIIDSVKGAAESFLHDMVVKEMDGKQIMLLSYWDGGYVELDVTGIPAEPVHLADSDFAATDPLLLERTGADREPEGNAHQAEFSRDDRYIVAADEDFDPYSLTATIAGGGEFPAGQGSGTPQLTGETITGQARFAGRACNGDEIVGASAAGQIAVVERGVCPFTEKVANVENAGGYAAVLVVNRTGDGGGCESTLGMLVDGSLPTFGVSPRSVAYDVFPTTARYSEAECLAGDGTQLLPIALGATGAALTFESYFDGWGYVRLFRNGKGELKELDQYAIPEAHDPAYASGYGDLSVHEVAMSHERNDLAYLSYYSGGFRVLRIERGELVEAGHFIDAGGNNFWGVEVFQKDGKEYVAASDRDYGLYIFEYTGD